MKLVDEQTFKTILNTGAVKKVVVVARGADIHIQVKAQKADFLIAKQTGELRTWKSFDTVFKWLKQIGIGQAEVNFQDWSSQIGLL